MRWEQPKKWYKDKKTKKKKTKRTKQTNKKISPFSSSKKALPKASEEDQRPGLQINLGMKVQGLGMQVCKELDWLVGSESLTAALFRDCGALAVHQVWFEGEGNFPQWWLVDKVFVIGLWSALKKNTKKQQQKNHT